MPNQDDIFFYAATCVKNKSVLARIGHSAKLHSVRSAVSSKGSAATKFGALVGAGIRATVNCIPIPVIGGLVSAIEQRVEKAIKSKHHRSNLGKAAAGSADEVKFTLKELSVEELDRFRWKVSESIQEFNKLATAYPENKDKKRAAQAQCEAYLDLALAAEQVNRRLKKLRDACLGLCAALKIAVDWVGACENGAGAGKLDLAGGTFSGIATGGVSKAIADLKITLATDIKEETDFVEKHIPTKEQQEEYIAKYHGKCDKWCCFRDAGKPDTWANCKNKAAFVLRNLADPFVPDSFNNNLGVLWKMENS